MRRAEPSSSFSTATNPPLASFGNLLERLAAQLHLTETEEEEPAVADSSLTNRRARKGGRVSRADFGGPQAAAFTAESARSADEDGGRLADDYAELSYEQALRSHGRRHAAVEKAAVSVAEKVVAAPVAKLEIASDPELPISERVKSKLAARDELPAGLPTKAGPRASKVEIDSQLNAAHLGESLSIQSALAAVGARRESLRREEAEVAAEAQRLASKAEQLKGSPAAAKKAIGKGGSTDLGKMDKLGKLNKLDKLGRSDKLGKSQAKATRNAGGSRNRTPILREPVLVAKQDGNLKNKRRDGRATVGIAAQPVLEGLGKPGTRVAGSEAGLAVTEASERMRSPVRAGGIRRSAPMAVSSRQAGVIQDKAPQGRTRQREVRKGEVRVAGRAGAQRSGYAHSTYTQAKLAKTASPRTAAAAGLRDGLSSRAGTTSRGTALRRTASPGTGSFKVAVKAVDTAPSNSIKTIKQNRAGLEKFSKPGKRESQNKLDNPNKVGNLNKRPRATSATADLAGDFARRPGREAQRDRGRITADGRGLPDHLSDPRPEQQPDRRLDHGLDHRKVILSVRLSEGEVARLRVRSAESHVSVSMYIRSCVLEAERLRSQVREALSEIRARVEVADGQQGSPRSGNDGIDQAAQPKKAAWFRSILKPAAMLTGALFPLSRRI